MQCSQGSVGTAHVKIRGQALGQGTAKYRVFQAKMAFPAGAYYQHIALLLADKIGHRAQVQESAHHYRLRRQRAPQRGRAIGGADSKRPAAHRTVGI